MKLLNLILIALFFGNPLNAQNKIFVGLNSQPLSINGGFEFTMPIHKKKGKYKQ